MLNFTNHQDISLETRREIIQRAVSSQPFFELLQFEVLAGQEKERQYKAKFDTDKDFFVTDVKGNFNQVLNETGTEFWLSIWRGYNGESLHKYIKGEYLPPSFQLTDARFNVATVNQRYQDWQDEILPYGIPKGDSVLASIRNVGDKLEIADCKVCLAGFFALENNYINERTTQAISESLNDEPYFELWKFDVTTEGIINNQFSNDRFARLVLGFGVIDLSTVKADLAESTVQITDNTRGLKLTDVAIPIEFVAPRLTALRDTHINYLPTEYLFEPFATLRFETNTQLNGGAGYQFVMLTRTV